MQTNEEKRAYLEKLNLDAQLGGGENAAFSQTMLVGGIGLLFTVLALVFIDKLGRRPIFIGGLIWGAISIGVVSLGFFNATYLLTPETVAALKDVLDTTLLQPMVGVEYGSDLDFKAAIISHIGHDALVQFESEIIKNYGKHETIHG